jgi:hypothetical protein
LDPQVVSYNSQLLLVPIAVSGGDQDLSDDQTVVELRSVLSKLGVAYLSFCGPHVEFDNRGVVLPAFSSSIVVGRSQDIRTRKQIATISLRDGNIHTASNSAQIYAILLAWILRCARDSYLAVGRNHVWGFPSVPQGWQFALVATARVLARRLVGYSGIYAASEIAFDCCPGCCIHCHSPGFRYHSSRV